MFKKIYIFALASGLMFMSTVTRADDITAIKQTLGLVLAKLQHIDDRLDSLETRMDQAEDDISILYSRADNVETVVLPDLDGRTDVLENRTDLYQTDLYGSGSDAGLVAKVDTLEDILSGGSAGDGIVTVMTDLENRILGVEGVVDSLSQYIKVGNKLVSFEGANVRVVNGTGKNNSVNGLGNFVVGYNSMDSGSHNLVTGFRNEFPSYGGFVAGYKNKINGTYSAVSGGGHNTSSGWGSSVCGGYKNTAANTQSLMQISADKKIESSLKQEKSYDSLATARKKESMDVLEDKRLEMEFGIDDLTLFQGNYTTVSGGSYNRASGWSSSVSGGSNNEASKWSSSVSGGSSNNAGGSYSSVQGGYSNAATGSYSSISGGRNNTANMTYQSILD